MCAFFKKKKKSPTSWRHVNHFLMEAMDELNKVSRVQMLIISESEVTFMLFPLSTHAFCNGFCILPAAIYSVLHMHHPRMKASAPAQISSESEDLLIL